MSGAALSKRSVRTPSRYNPDCTSDVGGDTPVNLQIPLSREVHWHTLPSPKIRTRYREGIHAWTHAYAGFSFDFALEALKQLDATSNDVVLDPFVGSGMTVVAASTLGTRAIGIDLDPFSALITRAKVALRAEHKVVRRLLATRLTPASERFLPIATDFFSSPDLAYAATVFDRVARRIDGDISRIWTTILEDNTGETDCECIAITAVILAGRALAKVARGSNPVWYRKVKTKSDREQKLPDLSLRFCERLIDDLHAARRNFRARDVRVFSQNFIKQSLPSNSIDLILTSPPYLGRLDYVVSHLPELALLSGFIPVDIEQLRRTMLGTTKMLGKSQPTSSWGSTCLSILEKIQNHSSYASRRYYHRFYCQYFADLFQSLCEMRRICRRSARGILVIQDSFYKELRIPIVQIVAEMGDAVSIGVKELRTETKTGHIGSMSPRQRLYAPLKALSESVLLLEF
jgi:hypothetical protein